MGPTPNPHSLPALPRFCRLQLPLHVTSRSPAKARAERWANAGTSYGYGEWVETLNLPEYHSQRERAERQQRQQRGEAAAPVVSGVQYYTLTLIQPRQAASFVATAPLTP